MIDKRSFLPFWENCPGLSLEAAKIFIIWVVFQAIMYVYLPGPKGFGQLTPAGKTLEYNVNGFNAYILTHVLFVLLSDMTPYSFNFFTATIVADNYAGLITTCCISGYVVASYAYIKAFVSPTHPDDRKFTGSFVFDYFWGIEFNPRETWFPKIGQNTSGTGLDWKLYWVGRHGMMGWSLINLRYDFCILRMPAMDSITYSGCGSLAVAQHRLLAANPGFPSKYSPVPLPSHITNSMVLINVLHTMYIADFFYFEDWYLRTIDIAHDHFGFMFAWGDSTWLTFMYALQAFYLYSVPIELPSLFFWTTTALGLGGYAIFRTANGQKDLARSTKGQCTIWGRPATFVKAEYYTSDGVKHETLLLTSGFWGIARHMNYTGDLMGCLAYCMTCGLNHVMPYFYFVYMTMLLVGRNHRDETRCSGKYGDKWKEYCKEVPRITQYKTSPSGTALPRFLENDTPAISEIADVTRRDFRSRRFSSTQSIDSPTQHNLRKSSPPPTGYATRPDIPTFHDTLLAPSPQIPYFQFDETTLNFMASRLDELGRDHNVGSVEAITQSESGRFRREAGILVPFCVVDGRPSVLLTVRNTKMRKHTGEIALPGGVRDPEDVTIQDTALRETFEEIHIRDSRVRLLGSLPPVPDISGSTRVTPSVGFVDLPKHPKDLHYNIDEVSRIFHLTIDQLLDPSRQKYMTFRKTKHSIAVFRADDTTQELIDYEGDHGSTVVWGLTAYVLSTLLREVVIPAIEDAKRRAERVESI
ncbi:7-dehydrocholesterol reductase [Gonapodya sp. JEL0774]|nr:7-dehydrocholesterol reductase [Gonapodya sp. JEL0774]